MPRLVPTSSFAALRTAPTSSRALSTVARAPLPRLTSAAAPRAVAPAARVASAAFSSTSRAMAGHAGEGKGEDNVRPPPDQVVQDIADVSMR